MDYYNDFFFKHELTHFCQIRLLKPFVACPYQKQLGVVIYEMATAQRPFTGKTAADLVSSILRDSPKRVTDQRAEMPAAFDRLLERCLAKDPAGRYLSARDLRQACERLRLDMTSEWRGASLGNRHSVGREREKTELAAA